MIDTNREETKSAKNSFEMINRANHTYVTRADALTVERVGALMFTFSVLVDLNLLNVSPRRAPVNWE